MINKSLRDTSLLICCNNKIIYNILFQELCLLVRQRLSREEKLAFYYKADSDWFVC